MDATRSLAWQITLHAAADDHAMVQVTTLPLKRVEWYELSEEELQKDLATHYSAQGLEAHIEFYKGRLRSFFITNPASPVRRCLEGAEARDEIVKIVFDDQPVLPWSIERRPTGSVRIGVIRGVSSYAECVVRE